MAISHSSRTPSNGGAFAFAAAAAAAAADTPDQPSKRQRRPSVRLSDTVALLAADARPRRIKQRKLSPPPAEPRRPKFVSLTDNTLDSFDENRDTLASIKRGIKAEKLRAKNSSSAEHYGYVDSDSLSDWEGRNSPGDRGGIRSWLDGMGLARYAPVFDMHEVDGEVLPLLTLEDFREMGITAVGPRRKMYGGSLRLREKIKKVGDSPSDGEGRNRPGDRGGVKLWLDRMGLARYAPVFDMHEVDGEVLSLLTLEDLKEMGISAVGPRRKMYGGILKLREKNKKVGVSSREAFY